MHRFSDLLPADAVVVEAASADLWEAGLLPEEAACLRQVVARRRREFTAGRNCARQALERLGCVPAPPILVGPQREPLFPAHVTGTITHTHDYCAAAAMVKGGAVLALGIDAEVNEPLGEGMHGHVLLPDEWAAAQAPGGGPRPGPCADKLVFSIKEAFYKAFFQVAAQYLDFLDARVEIVPADRSFTLRVLRPDVPAYFRQRGFRGRYAFDAQRVYSAIALLAEPGA
jgi:4'-phosphopantetheinyl transferase EntD